MANTVSVQDLSSDQRAAYDSILGWVRWRDGQEVLSLGGYAGTGKSTLVALIAKEVNLPAFCAYTGKAASVLRRKLRAAGMATVGAQPKQNGVTSTDSRAFCGTIHSLIYRPCDCREPKSVTLLKPCPTKGCDQEVTLSQEGFWCPNRHETTAEKFAALKPKEKFVCAQKDENGVCRLCGGKEWLRREELDREYDLIIVDEASMVDDTMLRDLKSYGVPILAVGDHGQLPPVGGSGSLMKHPALRLERIHRQAEGNPIIALSKYIRENGRLPDRSPGDEVEFAQLRLLNRIVEDRYGDASDQRLLEMGMACYTNRRRVGLNIAARRARGVARDGREIPVKGEHLVCLRNMKGKNGAPPISNGMRGVLTSDVTWKQNYNLEGRKIGESELHLVGAIEFPEDEIEAREYEMFAPQFCREKTFQTPEELAKETGIRSFAMAGPLFDFGYAMTVHKTQGSQFDDLLVCAERPGPVSDEDWRRWLYTAVTRAASRLTVLR